MIDNVKKTMRAIAMFFLVWGSMYVIAAITKGTDADVANKYVLVGAFGMMLWLVLELHLRAMRKAEDRR